MFSEYEKFSGDYYFRAYNSSVAVQRYWVRTRTNTLLEEIVRRLPKNSRILDLGCGSGVFIEKLKERRSCLLGGNLMLSYVLR